MKRKIIFIICFLAVALAATKVFAASPNLGTIKMPWSTTLTSTGDLLNRIANWFLGLIGSVAVLAIIYSGILYITAQTPDAATTAKKNLTWAITGLVIIILSVLIVKEVINIVK